LKAPFLIFLVCVVLSLPVLARDKPSRVVINADQVLEINGKKVFHVGFNMPPLARAEAWNGRNGLAELRDAGATFIQTGPGGKEQWTDGDVLRRERDWFDAAAKLGLYCWPRLKSVPTPGDAAAEAAFRKVIEQFKHHPALGVWNSVDEPEWKSDPVEPLRHAYELIRELDPHHPVSINHAPRGTADSLRRYNVACDITGADIYPIAYPPGLHGGQVFTNREISVVGDVTRRMLDVAGGPMPVWIYLQISWSGVTLPGKTLRMPTFPEQRFMTYQAIIAGARGIIYFGGTNVRALTPEDAKLGWNWTFWRRVLRPVVEEIGEKSPLYPALVAPESRLPVRVNDPGVEFCVREAGDELFVLACRSSGTTQAVEFRGLPATATGGEVLFESPRTVQVKDGQFTDWFAPFEVHVYRFKH
jgi:hypothetical protein